MHVLLVVVEQGVFFLGEVVRFQAYFESVGGFRGSFELFVLALVEGGCEVECVSLPRLLSTISVRRELFFFSCREGWKLSTDSLDLGCNRAASLMYSSPRTNRFHRLMA